MNTVLHNRGRCFGRLGTAAILEGQLREVIAAGGTVARDRDAGTVKADAPDGSPMLRALRKGSDVWLIMYFSQFYKPEVSHG